MYRLPVGLLFLLLPLACAGQAGRTEVRGDAGWAGFANGSWDNHLLLGTSLRTYLSKRFSLQPEFQYLTRSSPFPGGHRDFVLLVNAAYDFRPPDSRVVPYVAGGPGFINTREAGNSSLSAFLSGGAGVKLFVNDRWYVAPDVRLGITSHLRFSVGVGYVVRR